jgi:DNA helicase-2/ATP-dependent DNA helicase PcrA
MQLNQEQYEAVFSVKGPIVVCAGAGSGKTRIIAFRVLHLVNQGVLPHEITCVTFTNKAATEMKNRIYALLEDYTVKPTITTFHGYALKLIRTYGNLLGVNNYTIIGEDEQEIIIKRIIKNLEIKDKTCTAKKILSGINFIKNNYFNNVGFPADIDGTLFKQLYDLYEEEKKKSCVFDFDDLLIVGLKLLKEEGVLANARKFVKHLMVDEYQDTNSIQHMLVKMLSLDHNGNFLLESLLVVGDEDQSIYSWRGADVGNILNFKRDFVDTQFLKLTQNYRSTQSILSLANTVIEKNSFRNVKKLWTDRASEHKVFLLEFQSGYQEAEVIIKIIKRLKNKQSLKSCAILYRSHYQSRLFEEFCVTYNVKYKIYGGLNFYQRQEIKDILAYLYLCVNQFDKQAFVRCCNTPNRGFGNAAQDEFLTFWENNYYLSIIDCIEKYLLEIKLSIKIKDVLKEINNIIQNTLKFINPSEAISYIIDKVDYNSYIEKISENELEAQSRKENLKELIAASKSFVQEYQGTIFDFVDYLAILYEKTEKTDSDTSLTEPPILLMSIHAAKGLEFNTVFIVGLEEGIFPSSRSNSSKESLEEERRLLYVAMTRAENRLILSYALSRAQWGGIKTAYPSIFISDLDSDQIIKLSYKKYIPIQIEKLASEDLNISITKEYENNPTINEKKNKVNEIVTHPFFGVGKIIKQEDNYITVNFENNSIKTIHIDFLNRI